LSLQAKWQRSQGKKGIEVVEGIAEDLPFDDESFDFVLMITTICFLVMLKKLLRRHIKF